MRFVLPSLRELRDHVLGDRLWRPEHVDPRPRMRRDRRAGLRRQRVLERPQHRIAGPGRPRRGRHRELRAVGGGDEDRVGGLAGGVVCSRSIAWASDAELEPAHVLHLPVLRLRRVADPDHLRPAGLVARRSARAPRAPRRWPPAARRRWRTGSARAAGAPSAARRRSPRASRPARRSRPRAGCSRPCGRGRPHGRRRPRWRPDRLPRRASCSWSRRSGNQAAECPRPAPRHPSLPAPAGSCGESLAPSSPPPQPATERTSKEKTRTPRITPPKLAPRYSGARVQAVSAFKSPRGSRLSTRHMTAASTKVPRQAEPLGTKPGGRGTQKQLGRVTS